MIRKGASRRAAALGVLFAAVLLLKGSAAATESARGALKLCARVLIPSLFPYMVISSLLVTLGTARLFARVFSPICRPFRLPGDAASAIFLGALCGFPVGAKTACDLYRSDRLTVRQTERLIAIANNTGPAFVIEVVGAHCWGSRGFGLTVYAAQILASLVIGLVGTRVSMGRDDAEPPPQKTVGCVVSRTDILTALADAAASSALSVLTVCGFVVFFAVSLSLVGDLLTRLGVGALVPYLAAVCEFTGGVALSAQMGGVTGAFLTGFAVGWSGISVFAQCKTFTSPLGLRLRFAAVCKFFEGILTGGAAAVYYRFFFTPSVTVSTCLPVSDTPTYFVLAEVGLLVLFCLVPALFEKKSIGKAS